MRDARICLNTDNSLVDCFKNIVFLIRCHSGHGVPSEEVFKLLGAFASAIKAKR